MNKVRIDSWRGKDLRLLAVILVGVCIVGLAACGSDDAGNTTAAASLADQPGGDMVIEKAGVIEAGDSTDANHGNLAYDAYEFQARPFDRVRVEVATEDFPPLLKLVEASTKAVIAEWDAQYPTGNEKALVYTIAGAGVYEVRVYAMRSGRGAYTVKIIIPARP